MTQNWYYIRSPTEAIGIWWQDAQHVRIRYAKDATWWDLFFGTKCKIYSCNSHVVAQHEFSETLPKNWVAV